MMINTSLPQRNTNNIKYTILTLRVSFGCQLGVNATKKSPGTRINTRGSRNCYSIIKHSTPILFKVIIGLHRNVLQQLFDILTFMI